MEYNKYNMGPYNLHIIKTNKFKTVTVRVNFKQKLDPKEITYRNLLADMLFESSSKYPTHRELVIATENLYNLNASRGTTIYGKYNVMSFSIQFLNEMYTELGMFEKSFEFLTDIIFKPDIKDDSFSEQKLELLKKKYIDNIKTSKTNPKYYATRVLLETIDPLAPFANDKLGRSQDIIDVTGANLYEYYKQAINSDLIDIFVVGDVKDYEVKKIINNNFKINTLKKPSETHIYNHTKFRKRVRILKEEYDTKQSQLMLGAKISNLTEFERKYVGSVYSYILGGGSNSVLFQKVREENSLCYSVFSSVRLVTNLLIISAGIDSENYNKTVKIIRKEIVNMTKGEFDDDLIENAKTSYLNAMDELSDSPVSILEHFLSIEYFDIDSVEEQIKNIKKVDKQMIINFAKKINLDTIFMLEGVL